MASQRSSRRAATTWPIGSGRRASLVDDPDAIEQVHLDYYRAGARVATTASYQATVQGFEAAGLDRAAALAAIRTSVAVARQARERFADESGLATDELLVAGSVGPYGAMLADGSEYRGDYDPGEAVLRDVHEPRIDALLEAGVDLLAFETIPTVREAAVLLDLLAESGATAWLSYQCRDAASTAAGEPVAAAFALATDGSGGRRGRGQLHLAAPRAGTPRDGARGDGPTPDRLPEQRRPLGPCRPSLGRISGGAFEPTTVASWTSLGATWLGGCCGTGPSEISALATAVRSRAI